MRDALVFFLTWFPTYLATERHLAWAKAGFLAVLPFLGASLGVLAGGWLSGRLLQRTGSADLARKLFLQNSDGLVGLATIFRTILTQNCDLDLPVISG